MTEASHGAVQGPAPAALALDTGTGPDWAGYLFVSVFAVPFVLFNVLPIVFGVYVAFTDWSIIGTPDWVGLQNFTDALEDRWLLEAFRNTLLYAAIIVPGVTVLGLVFALFVNQGWPLSSLARTLFFAPNVMAATVIALVWVWIMDTDFGVLNHYLAYLGISSVPWLTSTQWSLIGVSITSIWWDLGIAFVLFLAALQDVPNELMDAAKVDGANAWQRFRHVTLPHLRPVTSMVITLQLIATMRIFSQVYLMTNGGPAGSSASVIFHIFASAINQQLMGYASALSVLLFIAILILTLLQRRLAREL
ncbi:MAG: carbohydrate ABC transporter permease [Gammaproteobacteria bacterium]